MKFSFIAACVACIVPASAQVLQSDVKPSASGDFKNAEVHLSWTLGETVIETIGNPMESHLTQGFHQPLLKVTSVGSEPEAVAGVTVFPNPTADFVTISFKETDTKPYHVELHDMRGTKVYEEQAAINNHKIDMKRLVNGAYILKIFSRSGEVTGSFKIEKLH